MTGKFADETDGVVALYHDAANRSIGGKTFVLAGLLQVRIAELDADDLKALRLNLCEYLSHNSSLNTLWSNNQESSFLVLSLNHLNFGSRLRSLHIDN